MIAIIRKELSKEFLRFYNKEEIKEKLAYELARYLMENLELEEIEVSRDVNEYCLRLEFRDLNKKREEEYA